MIEFITLNNLWMLYKLCSIIGGNFRCIDLFFWVYQNKKSVVWFGKVSIYFVERKCSTENNNFMVIKCLQQTPSFKKLCMLTASPNWVSHIFGCCCYSQSYFNNKSVCTKCVYIFLKEWLWYPQSVAQITFSSRSLFKSWVVFFIISFFSVLNIQTYQIVGLPGAHKPQCIICLLITAKH